MPAVVEADDAGLYVLKFVGAGQGPKALVAELIAGEIARALGLAVPEIVLAELDGELARTEADPEIQELLRASAGLNLALDYLPGSINFDPAVEQVDSDLASRVVWFDAFVQNVDRTARNTNLLLWHKRLWLIDHGAALLFHHDWDGGTHAAGRPFARIADHVLLPRASRIADVDEELAARLDGNALERIVAQVPEAWLLRHAPDLDVAQRRGEYAQWFRARLAQRAAFVQEAIRAHG